MIVSTQLLGEICFFAFRLERLAFQLSSLNISREHKDTLQLEPVRTCGKKQAASIVDAIVNVEGPGSEKLQMLTLFDLFDPRSIQSCL